MNSRILWSIGAFVVTFFVVYFVLSGGIYVYTARHIAYGGEDTAVKRDFGVSDAWIQKYAVVIKNEIDLKKDDDHDGLTLIEESQYNTNPYVADTDGDGYDDGREITRGYSPIGDGVIDMNENGVPDKWEIDMIGHVINDENDDSDQDGLSHYDEFIFGTHPTKTDTDGDGYDDGHEIARGYDPLISGDARITFTIAISKIDVEAPIVLSRSTDEKIIQQDLDHGVVHYPGTVLPGQRGNAYIAGHSSNYAWSQGAYNYVFKRLNDLSIGDQISVTMTFGNGKKVTYDYMISHKEEVAPDDARIFAQTQAQELTLTTCWPLGTDTRRIMVKAQLQDG